MITIGYDRIVIGDYGAFIEFDNNKAIVESFIIAPGQEYRIEDERYSKNVKYIWLTVYDGSGIKVYFQKKGVSYADYKPGKYYVSVHEVLRGSWCDMFFDRINEIANECAVSPEELAAAFL